MSFGGIKRDKADALFSKFIRHRDHWRCQRCGRQHAEGSQGLHASHFYGRRGESTRFDPQNVDAVCYGCHRLWGGDLRREYEKHKIIQLGNDAFNRLTLRAHTSQRKDRELAYLYVKKLVMELEIERGIKIR
jgi:hypothetical protein